MKAQKYYFNRQKETIYLVQTPRSKYFDHTKQKGI